MSVILPVFLAPYRFCLFFAFVFKCKKSENKKSITAGLSRVYAGLMLRNWCEIAKNLNRVAANNIDSKQKCRTDNAE